ERRGSKLSKRLPATGIIFRETQAEHDIDWHPAPRRQYIVNLDAGVKITASDGESRVIGTGEVILVEDTTGKGHLSQHVEGKIRHSIFVPIESRKGATHVGVLAGQCLVVNDRGLGEEVIGNRLEIAVAQIFETVLDSLSHGALDLALLGRGAGSQQLDDVTLFPPADPSGRIGRDIGNELAVGPIRCPGQPLAGTHGAEKIARGVALSAMCERSDKVSASIKSCTSLGCGLERARGKEQ